jgi:hypothetical protein
MILRSGGRRGTASNGNQVSPLTSGLEASACSVDADGVECFFVRGVSGAAVSDHRRVHHRPRGGRLGDSGRVAGNIEDDCGERMKSRGTSGRSSTPGLRDPELWIHPGDGGAGPGAPTGLHSRPRGFEVLCATSSSGSTSSYSRRSTRASGTSGAGRVRQCLGVHDQGPLEPCRGHGCRRERTPSNPSWVWPTPSPRRGRTPRSGPALLLIAGVIRAWGPQYNNRKDRDALGRSQRDPGGWAGEEVGRQACRDHPAASGDSSRPTPAIARR